MYLTRDDVARVVRVSERTVRRWVKRGLLPELAIGGVRRVPESALRQFLGLGPMDELEIPNDVEDPDDSIGCRW